MAEEWTEITADWKGEMTFVGHNNKGGTIQMGTLHETPGVSPMQLLLVGLAGCTGVDIVSILQKKRSNLQNLQVKVRGRRASGYPMIWTDIEVTYLLWGDGLESKDVEKAIKLSEDKYCSVSAMLGKSAKITSSYQIHNGKS